MVLAIDCEMVKTVNGLQLARVSIVDLDCNIVFDRFIKPCSDIEDYLTKYSGISEKTL